MWDHVDEVVDIIFEDGRTLSAEDRIVPRELRMTMLMGGPL